MLWIEDDFPNISHILLICNAEPFFSIKGRNKKKMLIINMNDSGSSNQCK